MCILLFVKDSIYTYRFQIENTNAKNNINPEFTNTYNVTTDFGEKSQFFSSSNMLGLSEGVLSVLDNSSNNFYCAVDLEKILADTSAIDSYKNIVKKTYIILYNLFYFFQKLILQYHHMLHFLFLLKCF